MVVVDVIHSVGEDHFYNGGMNLESIDMEEHYGEN